VDKIVVTDLKDERYTAVIWSSATVSHHARFPAKAMRWLSAAHGCPIFVTNRFLKNSNITKPLAERTTSNYLEGLSDEDLGRYKMQRCLIYFFSTRRCLVCACTAAGGAILQLESFALELGRAHCRSVLVKKQRRDLEQSE